MRICSSSRRQHHLVYIPLDVLSNEEVIDSQPFAVNLFTTGESDITPQTISLGGTEVTTDVE